MCLCIACLRVQWYEGYDDSTGTSFLKVKVTLHMGILGFAGALGKESAGLAIKTLPNPPRDFAAHVHCV